jgi:hypothetical protein
MANLEDKFIEQMTRENQGFNDYSFMSDYEKAMSAKPIYDMLVEAYTGRDMSDYGRLSFADYVGGLTPEEEFINSLGGDSPSEAAKMWNTAFGEDTELMKAAAMDYGKSYHPMSYPDADNSYKQGK